MADTDTTADTSPVGVTAYIELIGEAHRNAERAKQRRRRALSTARQLAPALSVTRLLIVPPPLPPTLSGPAFLTTPVAALSIFFLLKSLHKQPVGHAAG